MIIARLIQEQGARVHELHLMAGEYLLRLHVRESGELRLMEYADRVLTRREAGEWVEMTRSCGGYVPNLEGAA